VSPAAGETGGAGGPVPAGHVEIGFERTVRLPDDGRSHPLPPGLGGLPVRRVADLADFRADSVPAAWRAGGPDDLVLPLHEREALFLTFRGAGWRPCAVKVGAGGVNAVSGEPWDRTLRAAPQDYLVCPPQPWLDGINSGSGTVRQFVAVPLGRGQTVEGQVTGEERVGGLQILVFEPRPGRFPDQPPPAEELAGEAALEATGLEGPGAGAAPLGLGAGGQMRQKIYPDPFGVDTWQEEPAAAFHVHLVRASDWPALTGEEAPPTAIGPELAAALGLPWFELDDADRGDVPPPPALAAVRSIDRVRELPSSRPLQGGTHVSPSDLNESRRAQDLLPDLARVHDLLRNSSPEALLESTRPRRRERGLEAPGGVEATGGLEGFASHTETVRENDSERVERLERAELPEADLVDQALQAQLRATLDAGRRGIERLMEEGPQAALPPEEQNGLEAIVQLVGRPAILIQGGRFFPPPADWVVLEEHRAAIERVFRSVGRIELEGHPELDWVGTGFLVGPDVLMTNRHVAIELTAPRPSGRWGIAPGIRARVDFVEELGSFDGSPFDITGLIGIHGRLDMALFRVAARGGAGGAEALPAPLPLAADPGPLDSLAKRQVYVVGYPAWDGRRNDPEPMRRLFADIYNVKRLQPGEIGRHVPGRRLFTHDCSTLGGNSGSGVIDLASHRVLGLHFGGRFREANQAVALWELQNDPLVRHAGLRFV
jgi:Trypsin-like peptidase domain